MAEWGRKEYSKAWPSRTPVWTWTAILGSLLFFAGKQVTDGKFATLISPLNLFHRLQHFPLRIRIYIVRSLKLEENPRE